MGFWSKISGLNQELLNQEGEEVSIITATEELKAKKIKKPRKKEKESTEEWLPEESQGQLSVDIYEEGDCLIIESMIAGVQAKDIDIITEPDLIVIRGSRSRAKEEKEDLNYYYQECFWGKFSRTLILPCPIKPNEVKANFKNGILKITLPKAEEVDGQKNIKVSE
ncbi:Hsp20/alpha crystallin family protein [bacterium]|nr:Hsp20/alpha crystallin family protein [bacterium]